MAHEERQGAEGPQHHRNVQCGTPWIIALLALVVVALFLQPVVYANKLRGSLETFYITGKLYSAAPTLAPTPAPTPAPTLAPTRRPTFPPTFPPYKLPNLTRTTKTVFPPFNAEEQLTSLRCIPRVCNASKRFISSSKFTLLASFPGSGNTWTRSLIELGTRVWTGSIYDDLELARDGFRGELVQPYSRSKSTVSVIKSHVPFVETQDIDAKTTAAIVIMRSPFDAILAEYSRAVAEAALTAAKRANVIIEMESTHTNKLSKDYLKQHFAGGFTKLFAQWLQFTQYWLSPEHRANAFVNRENNVTSYEYVAGFPFSDRSRNRTIPVLVMFYEDFIRHSFAANHRLFSYLKLQMGNTMLNNALEATVCALIANREEENVKVKRKPDDDGYNIYFDEESAIVRDDMVHNACQQARELWFPELWGNCTEPVPQVNRLPISNIHLLKRNQLANFC